MVVVKIMKTKTRYLIFVLLTKIYFDYTCSQDIHHAEKIKIDKYKSTSFENVIPIAISPDYILSERVMKVLHSLINF